MYMYNCKRGVSLCGLLLSKCRLCDNGDQLLQQAARPWGEDQAFKCLVEQATPRRSSPRAQSVQRHHLATKPHV